jgi:hypothetical protein
VGYETTCANDYKMVNVTQTVTFYAVRSSTTTYSITSAFADDLNRDELAAIGGFFASDHKHWYLGANQITVAADAPKAGDYLTDEDGVTWHLIGSRFDPLEAVYDCIAKKDR